MGGTSDRAGRGAPQGGPAGELEVLQGTIERVTYNDERTLYSVLRIAPEEGYEPEPEGMLFRPLRVTAVGKAADPAAGLRVRLGGTWETHREHGQQFAFETLEVLAPADSEGLVRYLASSTFEGIGETLARRIVEKLGVETLERIRDEPRCLDGIRGLRAEVAERLAESVRVELGSHKVHAFLRGVGLGPLQAAAVVGKLGAEAETIVRADPYVLAAKVPGMGFATADRVARELGFAADDPRRARAALLHALVGASKDGHSLLPRARLIEAVRELLSGACTDDALQEALEELVRRDELALRAVGEDRREDRVYLPHLAHSEATLARNLLHLLQAAPVSALADAAALAREERRSGLALHPDQRSAVLALLSEPLALLTGGPGVGKTTIVRLIVRLAEHAGARVLLASPTGRAAKRLAEATGREAATIHRTLGYEPSEGAFAHDDRRPLEADLVVVDEVSMLDVVIAHHLLKAVQPPTRLVMVGDPDQLPSVGPGNVLSDLISSGVVPTHRLTRIFRQEAGSLIVDNAHRVLAGELPALPERGDRESDFYFFPADDPESCAERLVEVVTRRIPDNFGLDWLEDVQVIAPMYRGACGVDALNERLREAQGVGGLEVRRGERTWRLGDRVIQTRNDYEKEVFNGDMGRIVDVDPDGRLLVRYPEREVPYGPGELGDLRLAYAITVHRAQGCEFPAVVLPVLPQQHVMLQRNLLYTAITRARRLVVLVGSLRAVRTAVDNTEQSRRESALAERLVSGAGA